MPELTSVRLSAAAATTLPSPPSDFNQVLRNARAEQTPSLVPSAAPAQRTAMAIFKRHDTHDPAVNSPAHFQDAYGAVLRAIGLALSHHARDDIFREGLLSLTASASFSARPLNEKIKALRDLDKFASSGIYRGTDAKHVSENDKRQFLEALRIDPSITLGSLKSRDGITATELKLQADVHAGLRNDAAGDAFNKLVTSSDFMHLKSDTRIAVLSQISNYPDTRSIENLERLASRSWFQNASLGDQQRSAKIIAFDSQDSTGDTTIINNTLHFVLTNDHTNLTWVDMPGIGGRAVSETNGISLIHLSRFLVPNGNGFAGPYDKRMENILAHEVNHLLNGAEVDSSYRYFMDEYRAWYVGFKAENGRTPSQIECLDQIRLLITSTRGAYGKIGDAFRNNGSDESNNIIHFESRVAVHAMLTPEAASGDDPNNLDNHN